MIDKKKDKLQSHYTVLLNDIPVKIIGYSIKENNSSKILCLKTKIRGQSFPVSGTVQIIIEEDPPVSLAGRFHSKLSEPTIESWYYEIEL